MGMRFKVLRAASMNGLLSGMMAPYSLGRNRPIFEMCVLPSSSGQNGVTFQKTVIFISTGVFTLTVFTKTNTVNIILGFIAPV